LNDILKDRNGPVQLNCFDFKISLYIAFATLDFRITCFYNRPRIDEAETPSIEQKGRFSSSTPGTGGTYASDEETGQKGHQVQTDAKEHYEEETGEEDQKEVTT
jgi:hypothetical protein